MHGAWSTVHHLITSTAATSAAARPPRGHNLPPSRPRPPRTTISTARARLRLCRATCRPGSATTSSAARWWCGGRRARAVTVGFRCSAAARPAGARGQPGIPCSVLRLAGGARAGGCGAALTCGSRGGFFSPGGDRIPRHRPGSCADASSPSARRLLFRFGAFTAARRSRCRLRLSVSAAATPTAPSFHCSRAVARGPRSWIL